VGARVLRPHVDHQFVRVEHDVGATMSCKL
jgi:hypothetical protein